MVGPAADFRLAGIAARGVDCTVSGFWIRPMLVELLCGLGLAGLYNWEIGQVALFPADMPRPPNPALPLMWPYILHEQFAAHVSAYLVDARRHR